MYLRESIFIENVSAYASIKHQLTTNATETFKEELTFDREPQSQGVVTKGYYTDNGIFNYS